MFCHCCVHPALSVRISSVAFYKMATSKGVYDFVDTAMTFEFAMHVIFLAFTVACATVKINTCAHIDMT